MITISQGRPASAPAQAFVNELWDAAGRISAQLASNNAMKITEVGTRSVIGSYFGLITVANQAEPALAGALGLYDTILFGSVPTNANRSIFIKKIAVDSQIGLAFTSSSRKTGFWLVRPTVTPSTSLNYVCINAGRVRSDMPVPSMKLQAQSGTGSLHHPTFNSVIAMAHAPRQIVATSGQNTPSIETVLHESQRDLDDIVLVPGEAFVLIWYRSDPSGQYASSTGYVFSPKIWWAEGVENE